MNQEQINGLIGVASALTGMVLSSIAILRRDKLDIEITKHKMMNDTCPPPPPQYPVYPPQQYWQQPQHYQNHWWIPPPQNYYRNIDTDACSPYNAYGSYWNRPYYMPSNEVVFGNNDELLREIGRRPPQASPFFGRPY